ncbi:MAG: hypothetical protein KDA84_11380 [Planctomycetaceae bacterium]|nr:hypothetical protein [Planctomycetaceae bacterium]
MRRFVIFFSLAIALGGFLGLQPIVRADLNSAQLRELRSLESDVRRVNSLIRRNEFEDAEKKLKEIEEALDKVQKDAMVTDKEIAIAKLKNAISIQRNLLQKAKPATPGNPGAMAGVSFTKDVQPILTKNCGGCHGAAGNARGGLRLNSFDNMKKGGSSGALLTIGNANASLIMRRIAGPANQKMPPGNRPKLADDEIQTIRDWINAGAKDDSNAPNAKPKPKDMENIVVPKATGKETVSFTKDIAPFMVNLCMGCHSGNNPRGGLSLTSVNNMMKGGDSGRVIIPGDLEGSRLFRLVGGLEAPRMPQNQARITRKNYDDLKKWFLEGNKFDVDDPAKLLRDIVPTEQEIIAERLAKLSDEEFTQHRIRRAQELWTDALTKKEYRWLETRDFVVYGDGSDPRLQEIAKWADDHAEELRKMFSDKSQYLWKGKLAIFVLSDRFDFEEFTSVNLGQEAPREMYGFSKVSGSFEDAYIALQDIGDAASETEPSMRTNLIEQLTAAFLQKGGGKLPVWVQRGTGLYFASQAQQNSPYFQGMKQSVPEMLRSVTKPAEVFNDGTFSPAGVGAVGYTLVEFLIKGGTAKNYGRLIQTLKTGTKVQDAIKAIYKADPTALARQYGDSLSKGRRN